MTAAGRSASLQASVDVLGGTRLVLGELINKMPVLEVKQAVVQASLVLLPPCCILAQGHLMSSTTPVPVCCAACTVYRSAPDLTFQPGSATASSSRARADRTDREGAEE